MRIACVGGGPAGLYSAILLSLSGSHQVTVYERSPRGVVSGWGLTLVEDFIDGMEARDPATGAAVRARATVWDTQYAQIGDNPPVASPAAGHSIRRSTLVSVLEERALELGVQLCHEVRVSDLDQLGDVDLVIAADGASSALRTRYAAEFGTVVDARPNKYTWLGTPKHFERFTSVFAPTPQGWVWGGVNSFEPGLSGFFVEMGPQTWRARGYDRLGAEETLRSLEEAFAVQLQGEALLPQNGARGEVPWQQFLRVTNERWHHGNIVLVGDAAHTLHFSVGAGTMLAMTDAQVLADLVGAGGPLGPALEEYGRRRRAEIADEQAGALQSMLWFEQVDRCTDVTPQQFSMLLDRRRSPVQRRMPVHLYVALADVAAAVGGPGPVRQRVGDAVTAAVRDGRRGLASLFGQRPAAG